MKADGFPEKRFVVAVCVAMGAALFFPQATESKELPWNLESVSIRPFQSGTVLVQLLARRKDSQVRLALACFRSSDFDLRVIDNGRDLSRPRYGSLSEALLETGCVAGCNGSFFSRDQSRPKGQVVADGKRIESFDPHALLDASLVVREGRLLLEPMDLFRVDETVTQLIQSNPWLVRNGAAVSLSGRQRALRTFIAWDGGSGWVLGHAAYCSLPELAQILGSKDFQTVHPVLDVVNLDGGSSSALWIRGDEGGPLYWRESSTVVNFIGIRKKPGLK